jgi:hypothetical protein
MGLWRLIFKKNLGFAQFAVVFYLVDFSFRKVKQNMKVPEKNALQ